MSDRRSRKVAKRMQKIRADSFLDIKNVMEEYDVSIPKLERFFPFLNFTFLERIITDLAKQPDFESLDFWLLLVAHYQSTRLKDLYLIFMRILIQADYHTSLIEEHLDSFDDRIAATVNESKESISNLWSIAKQDPEFTEYAEKLMDKDFDIFNNPELDNYESTKVKLQPKLMIPLSGYRNVVVHVYRKLEDNTSFENLEQLQKFEQF